MNNIRIVCKLVNVFAPCRRLTFMISSGLKVPIPAIPIPDLAVPMAAPAELKTMAAKQLNIVRRLVLKIVG